MRLWKDYVSAMADCLLKANDDPATEAGKRLVRRRQHPVASLCHHSPHADPDRITLSCKRWRWRCCDDGVCACDGWTSMLCGSRAVLP